MARPYQIRLSGEAIEDLLGMRQFDRTAIRVEIERHLTYEPTRESRSRIKRLRQPFWAQFRLRVGEYRVYYDVDIANHGVVVSRIIEKGNTSTPTEPP